MSESWEHRFETFSVRLKGGRTYVDDTLRALGAEGWEAVGVTGDPLREIGVLLKRPVTSHPG